MSDRLDIVIFGATGYTGKYAAKNLHLMSKKYEKPITWGIAGRNPEKLKGVLEYVKEKTSEDVSSTKIIIADVNDEESLKKMTEQARVIVNCCGPYRLYGEQVIKACIETGTHHVDISAEPQFIEKVHLDYHKPAKERGVNIVSACGLASIPADVGVVHLQQNFGGTVNSVESYMFLNPGVQDGALAHFGTYESLVRGVANLNEIRQYHEQLYPKNIPNFTPKLKSRGLLHKSQYVYNKWTAPFFLCDKSVIEGTQRYFYENEKMRPAQVATYIVSPNTWWMVKTAVFGVVVALFTRFKCGTNLLLKHPKLFTAGCFTHEGPSENFNQNLDLEMVFVGKGWSEKESLNVSTDQYTTPPKKTVVTKITGTDPGYGSTSKMVILSAIMMVTEADKLPEKGGVYSPGAAFAKTSYIKKLMENNALKFEVVSTNEE